MQHHHKLGLGGEGWSENRRREQEKNKAYHIADPKYGSQGATSLPNVLNLALPRALDAGDLRSKSRVRDYSGRQYDPMRSLNAWPEEFAAHLPQQLFYFRSEVSLRFH
jgi:hypothetical protein